MDAAATAAAEATAVTHSFQAQLASLQQDMQSLHAKVTPQVAYKVVCSIINSFGL